MSEFNTDDGALYIPYRVKYIFNDNEKEGWAILKIQQSFVVKTGVPENNWIWRL